MAKLKERSKLALIVIVVIAVTVFGMRTYDLRHLPPLEPWHTYVPVELSAKEADAADWAAYLKVEDGIFKSVRTEVSQKLSPETKTSFNRYYEGSAIYPAHNAQDWNRSYILEPAGKPIGAVVLLHGLTDSPYSLRHIARRYVERGFVAVAIRLPGHGTVPAGLSNVEWEAWMAATRLAVREARRRTGPAAQLHLVGFSNGGALAVKYALDALENKQLARPDRIVLLSPMIGITRFARFAGLASIPAILPPFAKAAWLSIVPEFNPFKYNSFPVNGARQSHRLTQALQQQIVQMASANGLNDIAPILTFQSVMDFTVSTPMIISALYSHLPANGSELVLFDVNRSIKFGPLLRTTSETALARYLPTPPQRYRVTVITNAKAATTATVARTIEAGETTRQTRDLGLPYLSEIFSLSHVSIPFPLDDSLYGLQPATTGEDFGIHLGTLVPRGERGALVVDMDFLFRIASNPFFPFVLERIEDGIDRPAVRVTQSAAVSVPPAAPKPFDQPPPPEYVDMVSESLVDP